MIVLLAVTLLGMVTNVESLFYNDVPGTEYRFLSLSVLEVIQQHFTPGRNLLVLLPGPGDNVTLGSVAKIPVGKGSKFVDSALQKINGETLWPQQVFTFCTLSLKAMSDTEEIFDGYILFSIGERGDNSTGNLFTQLEFLKENFLLNPRAQFLFVVISQVPDIPSDLAHIILNLSWKYMIGNALLLISSSYLDQHAPNNSTSDKKVNVPVIHLFTFFPYSGEQNCSDIKKIIVLDKFYPSDKGEFIHNSDLVLKRNITNLYGCPVKVITHNLPPTVVDKSTNGNANCTGLEISLLLFILTNTNATAVFSIVPSTNVSVESLLSSLIYGLTSGSADIAVGALPSYDFLIGSVDATIPYFETTIQWIVPCPKPVPRWGAVFTVFPFSVWLCIFLCFVSVVMVMWLLARYVDCFNYRSLQYCLLNIWSVALEVSVHKIPQSFRIRAIFFMWIWVSFALCMVFQAFFTTFLVNPGFERKINTMEDLLELGIQYGYSRHYEQFVKNTTINVGRKPCVDQYVCLENAIKRGNFATLSDQFHVNYYRTNLSWHDSHLPICTMEENLMKVSVVMYLTKGHPLLERISKMIRRMFEAGMIGKWGKDFMYNSRIESLSFYGNETEANDLDRIYVVFTLCHLQSALFVLMFGYIISVSTVTVELIYSKFYTQHSVEKPIRK